MSADRAEPQEFYFLECVTRDPETRELQSITYRPVDITFSADGHPTQVEIDSEHYTISMHEAIAAVDSGAWSFWVYADNRLVRVEVVERKGRRYLRTEPDDSTLNNLSVFKECE